jgi:2-octaprenyl-6-methoxyphenol hydroxylase
VPPGFDERNLALAAASLNALQALGVLRHLVTAPSPVRRIHISRSGDFGAVRLQASDYDREAFGGVVIARELGAALESRLAELPGLTRYRPLRFRSLRHAAGLVEVDAGAEGGPGQWLSARLLLACDGSDSEVRSALDIGVVRHDYRQSLIVSALQSDRPHAGSAWERFTASGPLALLPRADGAYGAVCGVPTEQAEALMALPDTQWMAELQRRFGGRAGRFLRVGRRSAYSIVSCVAEALLAPRCVLLGNAAQTLHPIGAQGFNLGLRDALSLVELIADAADPGSAELLAAYPDRRREDREQTMRFSDGLARLTAAESFPHHLLRSLGLGALAMMPGLQAPLVAGAMGFRGRVPALAREVVA